MQTFLLRAGAGYMYNGFRRGMKNMTILFVFAVCLAASVIGGICGIGGGVLIKPVLDALGVMSVSAVSLLSGLTVLSMAVINVYKSRKSSELDAKRSLPLGVGAAVGGVMGKQLFETVKQAAGNDSLVGAIQAIVLGLMVAATLAYVLNKKRIRTKNVRSSAAGAGIGFALGLCSSFLGIGGGPMNLAVLYYFYSMSTKQAAINSLLIILVSQIASLMMSVVKGNIPAFDPLMLVVMVAAGIMGGNVAAKLRKSLSTETTDKLFSALLVVIILICCYNLVIRI